VSTSDRFRPARKVRIWSLSDQALSSLSNVVLSVFVAHSVTPSTFGQYALLYSAFWLCLGGCRSFVNEPSLIVSQTGNIRQSTTKAYGLAVLLGFGLGMVLVILGLAVGGLINSFMWLGLMTPAIIWQDALRYVYFAERRPARAFAMDIVWLLLMVAGAINLHLHAVHSLGPWVVVWGGGALLSAILGRVLWGPSAAFSGSGHWLRENGTLAGQMLAEFMITSGAQQFIVFLVPFVAGILVLSSLKAAQVAVGPMNVLLTTTAVTFLPTLSRMREHREYGALLKEGAALAVMNFSIGLAYATALYFLPTRLGSLALGENWHLAKTIAPLIALQVALAGASQGAVTVLQAMRLVSRSLIIRGLMVPVLTGLALVGAAYWGRVGLATGLVISSAIAAALWWIATKRLVGSVAARQQCLQMECGGA
jgi:O-antigen/teichoic acid export membrane protein